MSGREAGRYPQECPAERPDGIHRTKEGNVGVLRRTLLRAYAQEAWGLKKTESYGVIAAWLSEAGYEPEICVGSDGPGGRPGAWKCCR